MNVLEIVDSLSEEMYQRLKYAAETGKWPEGTVVDKPQRDSALQLIMAYQAKHLNSEQMLTIGSNGEIVHKTKRELKDEFRGEHKNSEVTKCNKNNIARFTDL